MKDILFALVGIILVLQGADKLTDGSVALARRFAIPELVIGLTVVAFGTSLPEFIVSMMASIDGVAAMGIGNIVGSNLFNTLVIVGATAAVTPIAVQPSTISKDIPFTILASAVLAALALDRYFGAQGSADLLSRGDGIALLGFFLVFMTYTMALARRGSSSSSGAASTAESPASSPSASAFSVMPMWKVLLFILFGLAGLIFGGELFVSGASGIARSLGVSDAVIGLTLVAGGTSLPELATSIMAARKGQSGLAIGNVIGSNLFNIFWILGCCSLIRPMPVAGIHVLDFLMLLGSGVLFLLFSFTKSRIIRWEGLFLVLCYLGYIGWMLTHL